MSRRKVRLAYIMNASARKATYKNRKKSLLKKVSELSTLCGIQAGAIIFSPYDPEPEVWPNPLGVQRVITEFNRMNEVDRGKNMFNQDAFLRQEISKLHKRCRKQETKNREKELTSLMVQLLTGTERLQNLTLQDLTDLGWKIDQKLKEVNERAEAIQDKAPQLQVALTPPLLPPSLPPSQQPTTSVNYPMLQSESSSAEEGLFASLVVESDHSP